MLQPTLIEQIKQGQLHDPELTKIRMDIETNGKKDYSIDEDGIIRYKNRLCIPSEDDIRKTILTESHSTPYTIHPGSTKMYQDIKRQY